MLSMVMNGVSQLIVRVETIALIVTRERNSNFILRYAALSKTQKNATLECHVE